MDHPSPFTVHGSRKQRTASTATEYRMPNTEYRIPNTEHATDHYNNKQQTAVTRRARRNSFDTEVSK